MKRKYIYLLIFLVLSIGIGYAYLNTNLTMENNVSLNALKRYTVTSTSSKKINHIYLFYGRGQGNAHLKYIQLEKGTATEYEPYYVKSDTKVTQNKDHTLTAIWKAN